MKKIFVIGLLLCALFPSTFAQSPPANNWIDFSKTYYRYYSDETGLHRLDYNTLVAAGLNNLVGSQLQVFSRGEEIPIYVSTSGTFGPTDYVEFYGRKNDGYFDTQLYASADHQSHTFNSLFVDQAAYFVTVNPSGNNKRLIQQSNNTAGAPPAEQYYIHENRQVHFNAHHRGEPKTDVGAAKSWFADFEKGEGYTSLQITSAFSPWYVFNSRNQYLGSGIPAEIEMSIVGLEGAVGAYKDQHCKVYVTSSTVANATSTTPFIDDQFVDYDIRDYNFTVPMSTLGPTATHLTLQAINGSEGTPPNDFPYQSKFAMTYATLKYPHNWDFEFARSHNFKLDVNTTAGKYIEITNFNGGNTAVLIDLTSGQRWAVNGVSNTYKVFIPYDPANPGEREFFISSTASSQVTRPASSDFVRRNFTDYSLAANQGNYLMIYHDQLTTGATDWVEEYRKYRQTGEFTLDNKTSPVGTYNVVKVNIDELYDQFAHGIQKHPLSIKNFVNFIKSGPSGWPTNPEHMLLLGKGIGYDNLFPTNGQNFKDCLVPTYGQQPSDTELSTPNVFDYRPQLGTGRIPARSPDQIRIYLKKLIEYEQVFLDAQFNCTVEARRKMKEVLLVTKGWGQAETNTFYNYTGGYKQLIQVNNTAFNVVDDIQETSNHSPGPIDPAFSNAMNNGLAMIVYSGHSHGRYWEYNGHLDDVNPTLTPNNFNNKGCYPFILSNSCFVGQIHRPGTGSHSQAEDYTLYEDGGSIGFLATLALAYPIFLDVFSKQFVFNLTSNSYGLTVGQNIRQTIKDIYDETSTGIKATCLEFTFAGDPAMEIYNFDHPEYILDNVTHTGTVGGMANLDVSVYNMGRGVTAQQLPIQVTSTSPSGVVVVHPIQTPTAPSFYTQYSISVPIGTETGTYEFDVEIDPNNNITEDCDELSNNFYSSSGNSQGGGGCPANAPLPFSATSLVPNMNTFCVGDFVLYNIDANINFNQNHLYSWNFGDGASPQTANGAGPHVVSYSTGGVKLSTLSVDYGDGCGPIASPAVNTTIDTGLSMVTGITCNSQNGTTTISWNSVPSASSYEIFANGVSQGTTGSTSFGLPETQNLTVGIVASASSGSCGSASATYTCTDCAPAQIQFQSIAANQAFCNNESSVTLNASPAGGTFSGSGVSGNSFNPSTLNPGSYQIAYNYNPGSCPSSSSINVTVSAAPVAVSNVTCDLLLNNTVSFSWDSVPGASAYEVSYNGVPQNNTNSASFTTTLSGSNTIEVATVSFDQNCTSEVVTYQCAACAPTQITFQGIAENQVFCSAGNPLTLVADPPGGTWSGNGITDGIFYPSAVPSGDYTLTYNYEDAVGCTFSESISVQVDEEKEPEIMGVFNLCPDAGIVEYSTPGILGSYDWTVSANGTIVSGAGTNLIGVDWNGTTAGTVSLTTTDSSGCIGSNLEQVSPDGSNAPQAAFSVNAASFCVGNNITFENGTANGSSYQWTLFNPETQESQTFDETNPSLVIEEPGTYNITLNALGCGTDQSTQVFSVTEASATINSDTGSSYCIGDEVNLYSVNTDGSFSWTGPNILSGDGGSAISVAPTGNAETYTLVYTDANGCTDEQSIDLTLLSTGEPAASFAAETNLACVGDAFELVNTSENAIAFDWTITNTTSGQSFVSSEFEPSILINESGEYDIQLSVNGCNGSDIELSEAFITVNEPPTLSVSSSADSVCPGDEVSLSLVSDGVSFVWSATVDGVVNEAEAESVTANVDGPTTFYVTATGADGCTSTESITIDTNVNLCQSNDPTCQDGIQNGQETGIDCGGPDCPTCPTCDDGIQNGQETGLDCGGPNCDDCPSCADGQQNGMETGVDCGGPTCPPCVEGCDIEIFADIVCNPAEGTFMILLSADGGLPDDDGSTYTVEGGGLDAAIEMGADEVVELSFESLSPVNVQVSDGQGCVTNYENTDVECPYCDDGIENGEEEGVDCGGPDCPECEPCEDGVQNGDEVGIDCGGSCAPCLRNLPNILTPNGDSYNDTWEVTFLLDYPDNNVKIFSRWGSMLYERDGYYDQFDGTIDGEELPKGTYYYIIDTVSTSEVITGTLTILR